MLIHTQENDLSTNHLNWNVEKRPLKALAKNTEELNQFTENDLISIPSNNSMALVREDTDEFISVVGNRYEPTQYKDICDKQAQGLEKSGLLNKGNFVCKDFMFDGYGKFKRVVEFKNITIEPKKDDIVAFRQTAKSSHDGSIPNTTDSSPMRLVCSNGMLSPLWQLIYTFRHTTNFNIEVLTDIYKQSTEKFFEMEPYFASMNQKGISKVEVEMALKETICKRKATKRNKKTYNEKLLEWLMGQFYKESNNLGFTMWAFYNTLTHWATHPDQYEYSENAKLHNIARTNEQKVLVFLRSNTFKNYMDR